MKRFLLFFFFIILLLQIEVLTVGCANIIPPAGGPRDSLPPVLVSANPKDSTTNFRGNRITLTFDEFIDLQDIQNNLLFTPIFENNPVIEAKRKTLTIRLPDSLESNTTYVFNFGNAIKDINEGNPLRDFTYAFSTGPALDSLTISGRVILAETGKIDSTLIVVLHRGFNDSAIVRDRPRYVTRLDRNGAFRFQNLPRDSFAVYALGGGSRNYMDTTALFAFANAPVVAGQTRDLTLYAYSAAPPKTTTPGPTTTTGNRLGANERQRLRFTTNLVNNLQDLQKNLELRFERGLRGFDSSGIRLATDSNFTPESFTARLDSGRRSATIQTTWKENSEYHLILQTDFAEDSLGRKLLRADTVSFRTKKLTDYGRLTLRVRNIDASRNPVLLFVQNDAVVFSAPIASGNFSHPSFVPGEYELRVLYDTNGNGKWDPGQFFRVKRQPEIVRPIERRITLRPNWDNEFEVAL